MYDYLAGKAAWLAEGLPAEGTLADEQRTGALVARAGADPAVVTPVLRDDVFDGLETGGALDPDPLTVRPSLPAAELAKRLRRQREVRWVAVTTPRGRLLGVLDADRVRSLAAADQLA